MRRRTLPVADDPNDAAAAEAAALRIIGAASQSAAALRRRLLQRGFTEAVVAIVLERCGERGYVDDAALAASVAARHRRANHGRARVVADLRARGVDAETVSAATLTLIETEQDAAVAAAATLWERSVRRGQMDVMARRRIGAALQRRGFSGDVVVRALRTLG